MTKKTNLYLGIITVILSIVVIGLLINQSILNTQIKDTKDSIPKYQTIEKKYTNLTYSDFKTNKNSPFIEITPDDLLTLLTTTNSSSNYSNYGFGSKMMDAVMSTMETSTAGAASSGVDFSQTNVQVLGIDEGDIVKTNGNKIFIAKDNRIVVINKVDVPILEEDKYIIQISDDNADLLSIKAMFVDLEKDVLYVIIEKSLVFSKFTENSILYPQTEYIPFTVIKTYKIDDNSLTEVNSVETKGNYFQSRMKDGIVYTITTDYLNNFRPIAYYDNVLIPVMEKRNNNVENFMPKIIVPRDVTEEYKVMYNLTSLKYSTDSSYLIDSLNIILNSSNTIYMSNNNLYITTQKNNYFPFFRFGGYSQRDVVFEEIYQKVYPTSISNQIKNNLDNQEKILEILNNYYQTLNKEQKEELYNKIQDETTRYYEERRNENDKTFINRIELLTSGSFGDILEGEVKGRLLNQFSLDEKDGYLRVATTYQDYNGYMSINKNAVTILDSTLKKVGLVDNIAPDETIYSARFMGDKLYLVTYRLVDPFFVIDLSSPRNPKILGELKITGYSDYLHPISDSLILGVGQETEVNQWGGENRVGVKIALFDVSDFSNPREVGKWVSNVRFSSTPVSYDHKSFLFVQKNNMVVLPISQDYQTSNDRFSFLVLNVDKDGVREIKKINHESDIRYFYTTIARSLYIGDELYTISDNLIKTYNLVNGEESSLPLNLRVDVIYTYDPQTIDVIPSDTEVISSSQTIEDRG